MTKFSRKKIQQTIEEKKRKKQIITLEEFCVEYLKIKKDDYVKVIERNSDNELPTLTDELIDSIRKAILFGCTQRQIAKLFSVSYKTISKAKIQQYALIVDARLNVLSEEDLDTETRRLNQLLVDKEDKVSKQPQKKNKLKILDDGMIEIIRLEKE